MKRLLTFALLVLCCLLMAGCPSWWPWGKDQNPPQNPYPKETLATDKNFNTPEELLDDIYQLSSDWDTYRKNLDLLVGSILFVVPDAKQNGKFRAKFGGLAFNNVSSSNKIVKEATDDLIYSAKVTGKFAADLSFVIGGIKVEGDHLYEFNLRESNVAMIPPDNRLMDKTRLREILETSTPEVFKEALWITAVKHNTLYYKDFTSFTGSGEASYSLIKVNGSNYTSDDNIKNKHPMKVVGIDKSTLFGHYSTVKFGNLSSSRLYVRNKVIDLTPKVSVKAVNPEERKAIRSAIIGLTPKE